jgi:catechol 2,3-dioxygenase-like lactoylglutathione lyase family enzyme
MKLHGFNHVNIGCSARDLPAIEKFYAQTLGLRTGFRPNFPNSGAWLYNGDDAIIHVVVRYPEGWNGHEAREASFDHIAFTITGAAEFRERLVRLGIGFDEQNVPDAGYQIFLRDPVGNKLEFNFPNQEAPRTLASGTLAPMQFPAEAGAAR